MFTGDTFELISSQNDTTIHLTGQTSSTEFNETINMPSAGSLELRRYYDTTYVYISADKPIGVYQINHGDAYLDMEMSLMTIPSISNWVSSYDFYTPKNAENSVISFLQIVDLSSIPFIAGDIIYTKCVIFICYHPQETVTTLTVKFQENQNLHEHITF